ncbi:MAG: hypothetical protein D3914_05605 [Candidatus Electrothrix sp. LOE2]|nr:hypothetical protein [Candidatus Electrothrix sp. LOE2]
MYYNLKRCLGKKKTGGAKIKTADSRNGGGINIWTLKELFTTLNRVTNQNQTVRKIDIMSLAINIAPLNNDSFCSSYEISVSAGYGTPLSSTRDKGNKIRAAFLQIRSNPHF